MISMRNSRNQAKENAERKAKENREKEEKIKELDQVAYVRFASVYREFKDVNTFMDELKKLLK